MTNAVRIVDLDEYVPTEAEILSWREMMTAPDQLEWEYDPSWAYEPTTPKETIESFRKWRERRRGQNHPLWAIADESVIGMIGIDRPTAKAKKHCAEVGFGVCAAYRRRGIGSRLLAAAIEQARS